MEVNVVTGLVLLPKIPEPVTCVQKPVTPVETVAVKVVLSPQMVWSGPAIAVGIDVHVITTVSEVVGQGELVRVQTN